MNELQKLIEQRTKDLALQHAKIMEDAIQEALNKFDCNIEDLILEYQGQTKVNIRLRVAELTISNNFYWDKK